jgi:hypothetical protein
MSTRAPLLLLLALAMFVLAGAGGAANAAGTARADLSTNSGVAAYLRSQGVDSKGFVVQRGRLNYAGPNCPGRGWNCTRKTKVVQLSSSRHGENRHECGPNGTLTTTNGTMKTIRCVVVQNTTSGKNRAKCELSARKHPNVVLECEITQANVSGDNVARIKERVSQKKGADQRARLTAVVTQTNGTGDNESDLKQTIDQKTDDLSLASAPNQNQEGRFSGRVTQTSEKGSNFSDLDQHLDQSGKARGSSTLVQRQFGDHFGDVDQTNGASNGPSSASTRSKSGSRSKIKSRSEAHQSERQSLKGPGQQIQIGPLFCCSTQLGGDPKKTSVSIRQESSQRASRKKSGSHRSSSQPAADQQLTITGQCTTVGTCKVSQRGRNNVDSIKVRERCSGSGGSTCSLFVPTTCGASGCVTGDEETEVTGRRR